MTDEAELLRRRLQATREALTAGVPHQTIRRLVEEGRLDELAGLAARSGADRDALWNGWRAARQPCPRCGGAGVHVMYGMPGPQGVAAAQAGDVHLAGPPPLEPRLWRCSGCGHQWGRPADDPMLRAPT